MKKMIVLLAIGLLSCGSGQKKKATFERSELDDICFRECERIYPQTCLLGEFSFIEESGIATCHCFVSREGELELKMKALQLCLCKNCKENICPSCCEGKRKERSI